MAITSRQQPRFYRIAISLYTAIVVGLIGSFAAIIGLYHPTAAEEVGYPLLFLFIVCVILAGVVMHVIAERSVDRTLIAPLQRISDVTKAIVEGAVSGRIVLDQTAQSEVILVAEAINRLAEKATRDITEMRRLERVRSEFVGNVSHELRTPIFSVQGYLETLLDGALEDPDVSRQFVDKAYKNALRLNALLSDLIDISRIESGELRMSFRYFDLRGLLRDLMTTLEIRAAQRTVTLHLELPEASEISVYGDKERLLQVLTNLVDNAIKYNREGGSVTVRVTPVNRKIQVTVQDTGIGIPVEAQARIFERFYRVDKDRSRAVGGTGLGLAIVKHILEAHNAQLSVESEPDVGTSISFELRSS